jgi:tetratricopeptide (TPR) repeat protein
MSSAERAHSPAAAPAAADWAAVRALFDRLQGLPHAQRAAALADPALDPALRAEVASLLAHGADAATGFLASAAEPAAVPAPHRIGQKLGAWRLERPLGAGGMGEVFEARRDDGRFQGVAAVKLLKRGMDSQAVLARFAQEQQALARLSHPHIARLLDAGITDDGLPYFVMERVQGRPIDVACAELPLDQRLALFLQLTDAVAHAHRNLLVHRDLKPSNVLVDDEGRVRLLDFGIAKALDPVGGGADAGATLVGERPFTPHYASPEQVRGDLVGTATDVYSLGVVLYVLLTGQRPYGRHATTAAEAARAVLEEQPTRPSMLALADGAWARTRRLLAGDLDNIVLKALAKVPAERYASVDALAADITAHRQGRPVAARPASPGYVLRKWLQRNRAAAAAAALGGLGLLSGLAATVLQGRTALALGAMGMGAGLVMALLQARRAQLARDQAARARDEATRHLSELRRLANRMVFEVNDALERGVTEGRRQLVQTAAQSLQHQSDIRDMTQAERLDLGQALSRLARLEGQDNTHNLGNPPGALAHYERALQVLQPLASSHREDLEWHAAMMAVYDGQAEVLRSMRRPAQAAASIRRGAEHAERAAALQPEALRWRVAACSMRGQVSDYRYGPVRIHALNELDGAAEDAQAAYEAGLRLVADFPHEHRAWRTRAYVQRMHAGMLAIQGRFAESVEADLQAWSATQHALSLPGGEATRITDIIGTRVRLAITLRTDGRHEQAHEVLEPALALGERGLGEDASSFHTRMLYVASAQTMLDLHLHLRNAAAGVALYEHARRLLEPMPSEDPLSKWHWQFGWLDSLGAVALVLCGRPEEAAVIVQRLRSWIAGGRLRLRDNPRTLDVELEANIEIAAAHVAASRGDLSAADAAARAAQERLVAMAALRDPRDAVELNRRWQLTVRLTGAPWAACGASGLASQGHWVAEARHMQTALAELGIASVRTSREAQSLAAYPI